jgi:hypothetical protein
VIYFFCCHFCHFLSHDCIAAAPIMVAAAVVVADVAVVYVVACTGVGLAVAPAWCQTHTRHVSSFLGSVYCVDVVASPVLQALVGVGCKALEQPDMIKLNTR